MGDSSKKKNWSNRVATEEEASKRFARRRPTNETRDLSRRSKKRRVGFQTAPRDRKQSEKKREGLCDVSIKRRRRRRRRRRRSIIIIKWPWASNRRLHRSTRD